MKAKTTRKWLARAYTCYGVEYCGLQYLLYFESASFYTCGVYGWNFDCYTFRKYAITTGYRNTIHHVDRDYNLESEYDRKAEKILDSDLSSEEKRKQVTELLQDFLRKVFNDESITIRW